jgi:hypothetical protein
MPCILNAALYYNANIVSPHGAMHLLGEANAFLFGQACPVKCEAYFTGVCLCGSAAKILLLYHVYPAVLLNIRLLRDPAEVDQEKNG